MRVPRFVRPILLAGVNAAAQVLLWGFRVRHRRPVSPPAVDQAATGPLNEAAEHYFANVADRAHLLNKPFSEPSELSRRLIDIGVLIDSLRLTPGDTVVELGAGSCWVSHLLNRFGCRTISIDVSATALTIGRELFERDTATNWALNPQFRPYDGHRLPLDDGSVDAIVLYDVFHHLPNPQELLGEMRRVLKPTGLVAMSEPGKGHAASAPSLAEVTASGVLEQELVLEDISRMALSAGFRSARCVIAPDRPVMDIPAVDIRAFMGGANFSQYWLGLCAALDSHYYVVLSAGDPTPTTARPRRLRASLTEITQQQRFTIRSGESVSLTVEIVNAGDTTWLSAPDTAGWTRLGAHLYRDSATTAAIDYDWARWPLPHDVPPGGSGRVDLITPPLLDRGSYVLVFDLVIEGVAWFADRESSPLRLACEVV